MEAAGEVQKILDEYKRKIVYLKVHGRIEEAELLKTFVVDEKEKEYGQKIFEIHSWENKLRILNGGRNRIKIDVEAIKKIPIEKILQMHGIGHNRGMFKIRNEKTPSCHFSKDKNLWVDHGSGEGGSVIDLYMKINGYNFKEAIKELNNFI